MMYLEQSTTPTVCVGPFLDPADGDTAITGLTTAHDYVYLSKNGGDLTAKVQTTAIAHDLLGFYHVLLDATDTGTLGRLRVVIHVATAMCVWEDYMVITHDAYQILCGDHVLATDTEVAEATRDLAIAGAAASSVGAAIASILTDTGTDGVKVATFANDAITAASINTGALTADAFAADAIVAATLATGVLTADAFAADALIAATFATDAITDDAIATGAIASTAFAAGAINAAAIANGAIDNATFAADVGSTAYATNIIALAADKAIANYDAPTATEMTAAFTEIKGATWDVTNTLEATHDDLADVHTDVGTAVTQTTATAIAHGVLDHDYTAHTTTSTVGKWINTLRTLLGHKSVEASDGSSVSYKATNDSSEQGTMSWDETSKTRGKYTDW